MTASLAGTGRIGGRRSSPRRRGAAAHWQDDPRTARRTATLLAFLLLFAVILHLTYEYKIAPVFSYLGYRYRTPDPLNYFAAFTMSGIVAVLLPRKLRRPSDTVIWILFLMAYIPSTLVPQYADILEESDALRLALFSSLGFALVVLLAHRGPEPARMRQFVTPSVLFMALGIVTAVVYLVMFSTTGLSLRLLSLAEIHDVRFTYRDTVAASSAALPYLVGVQGNVINPLFIVRGLSTRSWFLVVAGGLGQLLIYSVTGYKLIALSVPAIGLVCLMFMAFRRHLGITILYGLIGSSLFALLADLLRGGLAFSRVFISRLLLVPGILTAAHVQVFRDRPKAEWGYTFLAPFVHYPYSTTPAFMVGAAFTGDNETSANSGLFGDGYANFGYLGIFVEAFFLVLILWAINYAGARLPVVVSATVLLVPALALVNTSVFRSVLTSGFGAAAVLLLLLPREGWERVGAPKALRASSSPSAHQLSGRPRGKRSALGATSTSGKVVGVGLLEDAPPTDLLETSVAPKSL